MQLPIMLSVAPKTYAIGRRKMMPTTEKKKPTPAIRQTIIVKYFRARGISPSPSVFAVSALPPTPSIAPMPPRICR